MGLKTTNASLYIGVPLFTIAIALVVFAFKILSKVKSENKLPRWNAFQLPWDQWQVLAISWITFSSFVFYGVAVPTIPSSGGASTALYATQGVPYSMMLLTWLYLSFAEVSINRTTDNQWGNPKGEMYHCQQCDAYFDGLKRKHCRQCQKCVINYDHHCFFLNMCISSSNYCPFFACLTFFNLVMLVEIATTLAALVGFHTGDSTALHHAASYLGDAPFCIFAYVFLLAALPLVCGSIALQGLHFYLCINGITTVEYLDSKYEDEKVMQQYLHQGIDLLQLPNAGSPTSQCLQVGSLEEVQATSSSKLDTPTDPVQHGSQAPVTEGRVDAEPANVTVEETDRCEPNIKCNLDAPVHMCIEVKTSGVADIVDTSTANVSTANINTANTTSGEVREDTGLSTIKESGIEEVLGAAAGPVNTEPDIVDHLDDEVATDSSRSGSNGSDEFGTVVGDELNIDAFAFDSSFNGASFGETSEVFGRMSA